MCKFFENKLLCCIASLISVLLHVMAENQEFRALPSFLFGQSMGGAVALKMHLKQPNAWSGAFLVAPMCKVSFEAMYV